MNEIIVLELENTFSDRKEALLLNHLEPVLITHMLITHHDHDHIGIAAAFKRLVCTSTSFSGSILES